VNAAPESAAPVPFVTASAWCPNCGAPLAPASKFCNSCGARIAFGGTGGSDSAAGDAPTGAGVEAWISIGVGLFLIFMQPRFFQWASSRMFGTSFAEFGTNETVEDPATGVLTEVFRAVPYTTVPEFWMDLGPALFAVVLILDGIVLAFVRKRAVVALAFGLTVLATVYNLGYVVVSMSKSQGFAPLSFLAVLFGGFMCYYQWQMLQWMGATRKPRTAVA
jgi:hypothetical protein